MGCCVRQVLGLDLDGTVIKVKSGAKFPKDEFDWDWWHPSVPKKIKQAHADGYVVLLPAQPAPSQRRHPARLATQLDQPRFPC